MNRIAAKQKDNVIKKGRINGSSTTHIIDNGDGSYGSLAARKWDRVKEDKKGKLY